MLLPRDDVGAGPVVVLLHAGVADRRMWAEHLEPLSDAGFRVLALDLPGYGEAPLANVQDAPWTDVIETLDQLGIDSAALVGNSFGGAVAQRVAAVVPERVDALALISSPAWGIDPWPELRAAWDREEAALEREDIDGAVAEVLATWLLPDASPPLRERVEAMQRRVFELGLTADLAPAAPDPVEEADAPARVFERLEAPVLIAVGELDKPDFHVAADVLAEAFADARRELIPLAGHLAPLERPQKFDELLLSFLPRSAAAAE